jgi:hypothetical protein
MPEQESRKASQSKSPTTWMMQTTIFLLRPGQPVLKAPPEPSTAKEALFLADLVTIVENWWPSQCQTVPGWLQFDCRTSYPKRAIISELIDQVTDGLCRLLEQAIQAVGTKQQSQIVTDFGQFEFRLQFTAIPEIAPDSLDDISRKPSYTINMSTESQDPQLQSLQAIIDRVFVGLPDDPQARLAAIGERVDLFRLKARQELEPALNGFLRQQSGKSLELNESIFDLVNRHLRPLGLRIHFQEQDCNLHFLGHSRKNPFGRFMLVPVGTSTAIYTSSSVEQFANALTPLQLRDPYESPETSR